MSVGKELWDAVRDALLADSEVMGLVDAVFDKIPANRWREKKIHVSRGPFYGSPEDADCIVGQEITVQLDIWSQRPDRWSMDDAVSAVRRALHDRELQLTESALVSLEVILWRIFDDPDPLTVHGVVQLRARVEEPA